MSHNSIAKAVRLRKEKFPQYYCSAPGCLFATETALGHKVCPKHGKPQVQIIEKPKQEAAQASQETLSTFQVFYPPVYPCGLSGLAERSQPQADAIKKRIRAESKRRGYKETKGFNAFLSGNGFRPSMNW